MEAKVYRWADIPLENPIANLDRRRIMGEKMMLADVVLHPGCDVKTHSHESEQFAFVMSGRAVFGIGAGEGRYEVTVSAGEVLHLPSNVPHSVYPLEETHILDLLSPPGAMGVDSQT